MVGSVEQALSLRYQVAVRSLGDADARWRRERESEALWQRHLVRTFQERGREDLANAALQPDDFEPGADLAAALVGAADQVRARARLASSAYQAPAVIGWWPDDAPNARAELAPEGGGVLFVNTGLLTLLRLLAQFAAASADEFLRVGHLGADAPQDEVRAVAEHTLIGSIQGADMRAEARLWVMQGPRDGFRTELVVYALWYVIAHEYAHLVNPASLAGPRCAALDLSGLLEPLSESEVLNSQRDELAADQAAYRILFADHAQAPPNHVETVALGAALAMAAQIAAYYLPLAMGRDAWGWTHPNPEMRVRPLLDALDEVGSARGRQLSERFLDWAFGAFAIKDAKDALSRRLGTEAQ